MRTRRREPLSFRTFWYGVADAFIGAGFVIVIGSMLGLLVVAGFYDHHNNYAEQRLQYEELALSEGDRGEDLSEKTREERKEIARDLLNYEKQNSTFERSMFTDYELDQIENMAETGEPLDLDTHRMKYGDYFRFVYLFPGLPIAWLILSLFLLYLYWDDQIEYTDQRFADLPWRKPWPWICTILFGPVWWLTMGISAFRMRNDPLPPNPEIRHRVQTDETETGEEVVMWPQYATDIAASRSKYVDIRVNGTDQHRKHRVQSIRNAIEDARHRMSLRSQELKVDRQNVARLEAERRELQRVIDEGESAVPESVAKEEFEKIVALPEVIGFKVVDDTIELIVRAITEYKGDPYYIADFRVKIGAGTMSANAYRIKSGVLPTWGGGYPVYGGHGEFCFGDRSYLISQYLEKAQYYEATVLIIDCVRTVNEHHRSHIPRTFTKLSGDELAKAYQ